MKHLFAILVLASCACVPTLAADKPAVHSLSAEPTAAQWLQRAIHELDAAPKDAADGLRRPPSPIDLIALAQFKARDPGGLRQMLQRFEAEAASAPEPDDRFFRYASLAEHWQRLGDREAYLASAQRAIRAAAEVNNPYVLPSVELQLMPLLTATGQAAEADRRVRAVRDPVHKADLYCALALQAFERGEEKAMGDYLRTARRQVAGHEDEAASAILLRIGKVEAKAGYWDRARATAEAVPMLPARVKLMAALAERQHKSGDRPGYRDSLQRATEWASRLTGTEQIAALAVIARTRSSVRDVPAARETVAKAAVVADALAEPAEQFTAYMTMAELHARLGEGSACKRDLARAELARGLGAVAAPGAMATSASRQYAEVAAALARAGKFADAAEITRYHVPDARDASDVYWSIAEVQAQSDQIAAARQALRKVSWPVYRTWVCRRIAEAYVRRQRVEELLAWVDALETPDERAWACLGAAEGLIGNRAVASGGAELIEFGLE